MFRKGLEMFLFPVVKSSLYCLNVKSWKLFKKAQLLVSMDIYFSNKAIFKFSPLEKRINSRTTEKCASYLQLV